MNTKETLRAIRGFDALVRSGGPSHHCLRCGWEGVPYQDGCPSCGMYGNVQPIHEPEIEETGEIIEEYTINLTDFKLNPLKTDSGER